MHLYIVRGKKNLRQVMNHILVYSIGMIVVFQLFLLRKIQSEFRKRKYLEEHHIMSIFTFELVCHIHTLNIYIIYTCTLNWRTAFELGLRAGGPEAGVLPELQRLYSSKPEVGVCFFFPAPAVALANFQCHFHGASILAESFTHGYIHCKLYRYGNSSKT